jgi:hypothetical protein
VWVSLGVLLLPRDARRKKAAHEYVKARRHGGDGGWFPKQQEIFLEYST